MNLEQVRTSLATGGLNLTATLPVEDHDRVVPEPWRARTVFPPCQGVLIIGNAGTALWPLFCASPEARVPEDPLDRYTLRVLQEAAQSLGPPAHPVLYTERRAGGYLPLVRLAQRAGLGSPGRLGLLLHPRYGPWISIRGALFLSTPVPAATPSDFDPCSGCPAPCATACHGGVVEPSGLDLRGCMRTKLLKPVCRAACDARSACVVGPEHAFPREQIAHHSRVRWRPGTVLRTLGLWPGS